MKDLPQGFVLDGPNVGPSVPAGFVIDEPKKRTWAGYAGDVAENVPRKLFSGLTLGQGEKVSSGLGAVMANALRGEDFTDAYKRQISFQRSKLDEASRENPVLSTGAELGGQIIATKNPAALATKMIGATAGTLSKIPLAGRALSNVAKGIGSSKGLVGVPLAGAVQGGVFSGLTEGDLSGVVPGAIGAGAVGAIGKIARPIAENVASAARKGYVATLGQEGVKDLTAAQQTGARTLEVLDSVLASLPFTSGKSAKLSESQLRDFTKAALSKAGISANDISPAVRQQAENMFNTRYDSMFGGQVVKFSGERMKDIADIQKSMVNKLPTNVKPVVKSYIKDIVNSKGVMDGLAYQQARSQITTQARSMAVSDPFTANVLKKVRNVLDDAARESLPTAAKGALDKLNREYANYKIIQKAASSLSKDSLEGVLTPTALSSAVEMANKAKSQAGYGDLYDLSRAGRAVLADSVPNSGTAQRLLVQGLLTGGGGAVVGGGTYAATGDPQQALTAAALAIGGPSAVQYFINSPAGKTYLTSGIPGLRALGTPDAKMLAAMLSSSLAGENK